MKGGERMNKLLYKFSAGFAAVSLFALAAVPSAFAYTGVEVSGNGAFSDNNVRVNNNYPVVVRQNNFTDINNRVNTYQNTGNNRVFGNTGGDVYITTGDANAYTNINNMAGSNYAAVNSGMYY